jgi:hypothetical protein
VNTTCSHLHSFCATGVSSGLATSLTLSRVSRGRLGDLLMTSFLYRSKWLLLGFVLNGMPCMFTNYNVLDLLNIRSNNVTVGRRITDLSGVMHTLSGVAVKKLRLEHECLRVLLTANNLTHISNASFVRFCHGTPLLRKKNEAYVMITTGPSNVRSYGDTLLKISVLGLLASEFDCGTFIPIMQCFWLQRFFNQKCFPFLFETRLFFYRTLFKPIQ